MKLIFSLSLLFILLSNFYAVVEANQSYQVLAVHSYSQEYAWTKSQHQGFVDKLTEKPLVPIYISTEYLDTKRRNYNSKYAAQFTRYIQEKYSDYIPDIIYVTDDNALLYAKDYLLKIYPNTPVIFSGVNDYSIIKDIENLPIRGVFEKKDILKNLNLIHDTYKEDLDIIILGDGSNTYNAIEFEIKKQVVDYPNINTTFVVQDNIEKLVEDLHNRSQKYIFLTTIGGIKSKSGSLQTPQTVVSKIVNAGNFVIFTMEDAYFFDGVLGGYVTSGNLQGSKAAWLVLDLYKGKSIQQIENIVVSPNTYIFDQSELNNRKIILSKEVKENALFYNIPPSFYASNRALFLVTFTLMGALLIVLIVLIFVSRVKNKEVQIKQEKKRSTQIERYQNALMVWSKNSYETIDDAFKKAAEISSNTLDVKRVSIWLYNETKEGIECHAMYISGEGHSSGGILLKADLPNYFAAMEKGRRLVINDVRNDPVTNELVDPYLIENNIYSMLDVPIFYDGIIIGVVCHEHIGDRRIWTANEQDFSSHIASEISLSLEIDKRKATEKNLQHQAFHDSLTGLPNRVLFLDRIEQEIIHASRENTFFAVLFMDLDHFKQINDSFGHSAGDTVLISISDRLKKTLRAIDTIARFGGDEFTILLSEFKNVEDINEIVLKLLDAIQQPLIIDSTELVVTTSIGISVFPNDGKTAEILLRNADAAMYRTKDKGRNAFEFYTEDMTVRALEKLHMIANLKRALEQDEFEVYYQPQYDNWKKQLVGLEALVRWQHPDFGFLSPARFLPAAEESGLIVALDRWVMRESLQQMKAWRDEGLALGRLSLNLTMQHIDQKDFLEFLTKLMSDIGCTGESIAFEVTEGQLMKNPEKTIESLNCISKMGIKIAIDDFGTGYSSLAYLKKLPVDMLKIDKEFVRDLPGDEDDVSIVKSIIALSKSMNMEVLAEGVETEDQLNFLTGAGCNLIQGYYLSHPKPASDIPNLINYPLGYIGK